MGEMTGLCRCAILMASFFESAAAYIRYEIEAVPARCAPAKQ